MRYQAAAIAPSESGGNPPGRTDLEVYTQCARCRDYINVTFWIKSTDDPKVKNARLEPSVDAALDASGRQVVHRRNGCGGSLRAIAAPYTLVIDGMSHVDR